MDASLYSLINNSFDVSTESNYGYFSYYGPKQKYKLRSSEAASFWSKYCALAYDDDNGDGDGGSRKLCFGERLSGHVPLIASFKLKFEPQLLGGSEPYGEDFILGLVYCFQETIFETIKNKEETVFVCAVLEADADFMEHNKINVHFKLQFPYCRIEPNIQKRFLIPKVIQKIRGNNVLSKLHTQPSNDWQDIIDMTIYDECWPLYKSNSVSHHPKLSLNHIYPRLDYDQIDTMDITEVPLTSTFNPHLHTHVYQGIVPRDLFLTNTDPRYWIPIFLSVSYYMVIMTLKESADREMHNIGSGNTNNTGRITDRNHHSIVRDRERDRGDRERNRGSPGIIKTLMSLEGTVKDKTPQEIALELLPFLALERVEQLHYWKDVGASLYSAFEGKYEGLEQWITFSERSDKFTASDCRDYYYEFRIFNPITVKTIAWYAREDSPEAYDDWHREWCIPYLTNALSMSHYDVAAALYHCYWLEFCCSKITGKKWFYFEKHVWSEIDSGQALRKLMSDGFRKRFETLRRILSEEVEEADNQNIRNMCEPQIKRLTELIYKLKTVSFKNNILTEAMEIFYNSRFDDYINVNPDLMGVQNGIIECCDKYAIFRRGKPEDFVTICSPTTYEEEYDWNHPKVRTFLKWMHQAFVEEERFAYVMRLFSSFLRSKNSNKILPILTGDTNSSKSMTKKLLECVFGTYAFTFPTEVLTERRRAGGPSPETALARHAKITFVQEPDENVPIRSGALKVFTGLDKFFGRLCNENGGNMEAMFTLMVICNKIPVIPGADNAIKTRLRIISFLSSWCVDAPESEEEQFKQRKFPINYNFENIIPGLASAALWVFVQYYAEYKMKGLSQPKCVTEATEKYWEENDVYVRFIRVNLEKAIILGSKTPSMPDGIRNMSMKLSMAEIYEDFKKWFGNNFHKETIPGSDVVLYQLEQKSRLGPSESGVWCGWNKRVEAI